MLEEVQPLLTLLMSSAVVPAVPVAAATATGLAVLDAVTLATVAT